MTTRLTPAARRALSMLATSRHNGATSTLMLGLGYSASLIRLLVNSGLATLTHEEVDAGDKVGEVSRVRITKKGRTALAKS